MKYPKAQLEDAFGGTLINWIKMKENLLYLEYLSRSKYQDYQMGKLMLCMFKIFILRIIIFKYLIFVKWLIFYMIFTSHQCSYILIFSVLKVYIKYRKILHAIEIYDLATICLLIIISHAFVILFYRKPLKLLI